jgi:GxxExxY protein
MLDMGLPVETEVSFKVYYKDHIVGDYRADMIVDHRVIVELKAVSALTTIHEVQLVNYLTATGIDDGILINFGSEEIEIRHKNRLYQKNQ